jgi:MFS family permease
MPVLISQDGRWWWNGTQWRSRVVEGRLDLFWFTSTPEWFARVVIIGLIGLIPIVGAINLLGWTLTATDMVRRGWKELPPAGFQYLERGVAPFVVGLVYGVLLFLVVGILAFFTLVFAMSGRTHVAIAIGFALVIFLFVLAWWLISLYLFATVLVAADRLGIAKAVDPTRLFALARANHDISLHVALVYAAASIAIVAIGVATSFIVPFSSLVVSLGLPAVYAMVVPSLVAFRVETAPSLPPTGPV